MKPASKSQRFFNETKLLSLIGKDKVEHKTVGDLLNQFDNEDLLIINNSATLPSSFQGYIERSKEFCELRLAAFNGPSTQDLSSWKALLFGSGNWSLPTEHRAPAPQVNVGDEIIFSHQLKALIKNVSQGRILEIEFQSPHLIHNLYRSGKPIQYSYLEEELQVWDQQSIFSGPPVSVEPPSSHFPLSWELIFKLKEQGVKVAFLTHSAGISSSGDSDIDQLFPLDEWSYIPQHTIDSIKEAQSKQKRVIALGTTVIRAIESAGLNGELQAGPQIAQLKISSEHQFKYINTLITGMHEPDTSHMEILNSFCDIEHIRKAYAEVEANNYRGHEYGDLSLLDCKKTK